MKNRAEVIGSRYAVGMALAALGLIQLLLISISFVQCRLCPNAPYFFITMSSKLPITFLFGGFCLFAIAYSLGRRAGRQIIVDKEPFWWTGSMTALPTFLLVTSIMVLIGNLEIAWKMNRPLKGSFEGILPGLSTLLTMGWYPAVGLGLIYGGLLKLKTRKQT
jgi:hypothetical protein